MSDLIKDLIKYANPWRVASEKKLSKTKQYNIAKVIVVEGPYSKTALFIPKPGRGERHYIPLLPYMNELPIGTRLNKNKLTIRTLVREGYPEDILCRVNYPI